MPKRNTQVRISPETADAIREIAADLGFFTGRGVGAGKIGNAAALLDELAARWRKNPEAVRDELRVIFNTSLTK